jgi:hypothetical protein
MSTDWGAGDREERALGQVIDERDAAEDALSQAFYLITGHSPEWSNVFGHAQALEEIGDACALLREAAKSWRPITDAPRDGTHIILAFGQDHACEGWYEDDDNQPRPWAFIDTGDFNKVMINHARDGDYGPSHWQPMPYREPRTRPSQSTTSTGGPDGR